MAIWAKKINGNAAEDIVEKYKGSNYNLWVNSFASLSINSSGVMVWGINSLGGPLLTWLRLKTL